MFEFFNLANGRLVFQIFHVSIVKTCLSCCKCTKIVLSDKLSVNINIEIFHFIHPLKNFGLYDVCVTIHMVTGDVTKVCQ